MGVKMDNTFVYNIVAKCIVHFNSHFYFHFNFHFNSILIHYALLNFSLPCRQRGQRQSSGRSSKATPSCSAGS